MKNFITIFGVLTVLLFLPSEPPPVFAEDKSPLIVIKPVVRGLDDNPDRASMLRQKVEQEVVNRFRKKRVVIAGSKLKDIIEKWKKEK